MFRIFGKIGTMFVGFGIFAIWFIMHFWYVTLPIIVIKPEKEYGEFYEGYKKFVEYGAFECSNISHVITKISES